MTTPKRKSISKKTRFEIFKRDSFTCQYCGKKAPDVLLEIEHIKPVSKGGTNDLLNLTTACTDCNAGKSDRELSDSSVIDKQRKQLEQLEERRQQIEMMMEWHTGLKKMDDYEVEKYIAYFNETLGHDVSFTETGISNIKKNIKKFGLKKVLEAVDVVSAKYSNLDIEGQIKKVSGVLSFSTASEEAKQVMYINAICRNRFGYYDSVVGKRLIKSALERYTYEFVSDIAKRAFHWTDWLNSMQDILTDED